MRLENTTVNEYNLPDAHAQGIPLGKGNTSDGSLAILVCVIALGPSWPIGENEM